MIKILNVSDFPSLQGLSAPERAASLITLRRAMQEAAESFQGELQTLLATCGPDALAQTAKTMGVSTAVVERMAVDPATPDVALLLQSIRVANTIAELPLVAVYEVADALGVEGATDDDIRQIAQALVRIAEEAPIGDTIWSCVSKANCETFARGVHYARVLLGLK
ncbi:hypothetical protein ACFWY5_29560 [Nonomuraea sp. NPDC059007]|uniref:hypothetical protein n=1 Tax=Nonomuraea sp. NPDC059007 TaxID=3346692 RepID=UPI003687A24D